MIQKLMTGEVACDLLNACGWPDDVAALVRQHGSKGKRKCPYTCVLASFISDMAGTPWTVGYLPCDNKRCFFGAAQRGHYDGGVQLNNAVREFVLRFDSGQYPDLVE